MNSKNCRNLFLGALILFAASCNSSENSEQTGNDTIMQAPETDTLNKGMMSIDTTMLQNNPDSQKAKEIREHGHSHDH